MFFPDDARVLEAKQKGMAWCVDQLRIEGLKPSSGELIGPCPKCGGKDRFNVHVRKDQFLCRRCESAGGKGDCIALVMFVLGLSFPEALTWMCGPSRQISEAERAELAKARAASEAKDRREADRRRAKAIAEARAIWSEGKDPEGTPVRDYLVRRGIPADRLVQLPVCLRFHPALPYMVQEDGGIWHELHRGPAMLAAIQNPQGRFSAVHRTWLDLSQPKGKLVAEHNGARVDAKKSWGSKKGGSIRLATPKAACVMVMAEGIETTLSAMVSGAHAGAAFWCGVDLGNMAGRRLRGEGLKYAGLPDLDDEEAFLPPVWVERLIYVQDGDSEPRDTRAKLEAGLRRAMATRDGLRGQIVRAPAGFDLNDLLMGAGPVAAESVGVGDE